MAFDPFFALPQSSPIFSVPGLRTGVVALVAGVPLAAYLPPGPATLLQVQIAAVSAIAAGSVKAEVVTLNLDTLAVVVVDDRTLDPTHTDEVLLLALALSPRLAVAVLLTADGAYVGADSFIATLTGTLDG